MSAPDSDLEREVFLGFLEESLESLSTLDSLFIKLERDPQDLTVIDAIMRPVHSLKGNAPFFGLMRIKSLAHELESLLVLVKARKIAARKAIVDHLLTGTDELRLMVERVRGGEAECHDESRVQLLIEITKQLAADTSEVTLLPPVELPPEQVRQPKGEATKHMRIPEERIDSFLEFVGETIIVGETLRHLIARLGELPIDRGIHREFVELQSVFARQLNGLEKSVMSIRKVSVKPLLQKVPRLVRDVAVARNKDIVVEIEGDDVEVDKSLIELLDAPLTHMARNAADHGIETPEVRVSRGKSPQGIIRVRCQELEHSLQLVVEDDGGGLNYAALQQKAEAMGLIPPGATMDEADVVNLLFMAGVSTAKEVSDVSGRGVGMDVVKRAIEDAGGSITVSSEPGFRTTFTLTLRKSVITQIIQGFVVSVADHYYALPSERIIESWSLATDAPSHVAGSEPFVSRGGRVRKVVSLRNVLGISTSMQQTQELAVTLQASPGEEIVLLVDSVIGLKQLVLRELDPTVNPGGQFTGVSIMGDGKLALVLDMGAFQAH